MSARDDLAGLLVVHKYKPVEAVCSCSDSVQVGLKCDPQTHEQHVADVIVAAGWTPPGHEEGAGELPAPTPD